MSSIIENTTWDFVIIGAGPSGSAAAINLASKGKSVLLIDKSSFPRDKVCGCCLNEKSLRLLDSLGVLNKVMEQVSSKLENLSLTIANKNFNIPLSGNGLAVSRILLDELLITQAIKNGTTFLPSTKVKINTQLANTEFRSIKIEGGNNLEIKSRFIILATGLSNPKIFIDPEEQKQFKTYISKNSHIGVGAKVDCDSINIKNNEIKMYVNKEGYVGITRLEDGNIDLAGAISAHKDESLKGQVLIKDTISKILPNNIFKNKNDFQNIVWQGTPLLTRESKLNISKVFLIGDANRYVEPFTGQGISWALESGVMISEYLENTLTSSSINQKNWKRVLKKTQGNEMLKCNIIKHSLRYPKTTSKILSYVLKIPNSTHYLTTLFGHGMATNKDMKIP